MIEGLDDEATTATELLSGLTVQQVWRHRANEIGLEFTDGTRLFVNISGDALEVSIT